MSSTEVIARPIFKSAEYLRELMRRNKPSAEQSANVEPNDVPPHAPVSAFVMGDEVIECEEVGQ